MKKIKCPNRRVKCPTSENREERVTEDFAEVYDFFLWVSTLKEKYSGKNSPGENKFQEENSNV